MFVKLLRTAEEKWTKLHPGKRADGWHNDIMMMVPVMNTVWYGESIYALLHYNVNIERLGSFILYDTF